MVGEFLGSAAGALPLGETVSPRIWVWEVDLPRAEEVIDERTGEAAEVPVTLAEGDECGATDASEEEEDEEEEEEEPPPTPAARFHWLGRVLVLLGAACIVVGAAWVFFNWTTMRQCSAATTGILAGYGLRYSESPPADFPLPQQWIVFTAGYEAWYAYTAEGKTYYAKDRASERPRDRQLIHYDPLHPATKICWGVDAAPSDSRARVSNRWIPGAARAPAWIDPATELP